MKLRFFANSAGVAPQPAQALHMRRRRRAGVSWLVMVGGLLLALFLGIVGGLDSLPLLMVVAGAVFAVLFFFMSTLYGLLAILFVFTLVVQGSLSYFFAINSAIWVAFGLAIMFFVRALLAASFLNRDGRAVVSVRAGKSVVGAALLYLTFFFLSLVFNRVPISQIISSIKAVVPMFGVLFALFLIAWPREKILGLWKLLIMVCMLQLPVVLYQHFFIATERTYDSIVGTFGGIIGGGGNSAGMVWFTIMMMGFAMACWHRGVMSRWRMLLICAVGVAVILLGEVKASFLWLPFVSFWILRERILKNVATLITYLLLFSVFMLSTYAVYHALYWGKTADKGNTVSEKLDARGGYFFDPNNVNYRSGEISRGASIALWAKDASATLPRRLIGYGPGASKPAGMLGPGDVARRHAPLFIDITTVAVLLWDVGVLGFFAYSMMPLLAIGVGRRYLAKGGGNPYDAAVVDTCVPVLMVILTTFIYNKSLMQDPSSQLLFMFCLGSVVQICRYRSAAPALPQQSAVQPAGCGEASRAMV